LIRDPDKSWNHAVVSTWMPNNHCVIKDHWRYIHYKEGAEELYDLEADPDEFHNLASNSTYAEIKQDLAQHLPEINQPLLTPSGNAKRKSE
jgi:hypothetical protein